MNKVTKLNPSIDIIPLQGSSGDNRLKSMNIRRHGLDISSIYGDSLILDRVQMYLYENEDKVYVDINKMSDSIQKKYREYRNRKRGPFREMVRKAYDAINESISTRTQWKEDEDEVELSDSQNDQDEVLRMYRRSMSRKNGNSSDKELIDISSDDDQNKIDSKKDIEVSETNKRPRKRSNYQSANSTEQPRDKINFSLSEVYSEKLPSIERCLEKPDRKRQKRNDGSTGYSTMAWKKIDMPVADHKVTFANIGGCEKVIKSICKLLFHMKHLEVFTQLGISPPRGFLLFGPPGCGKTLLAYAIAGELNMPLLKIAGPELVAGVSGESEARIRELFDQAVALSPCVLFLDEIDAVAPHRATAQKEMERRIVSQLLACLDDLNKKENGNRVLVVGATNRPDSLDPALRRAGRFDREVSLGIPDKEGRKAILDVHTASVKLSSDIDLYRIASLTPGFVGADLVALIREASMAAINRIFVSLKNQINNESDGKVMNAEEKKITDEGITEIVDEDENLPKKNEKECIATKNESTEKRDETNEILIDEGPSTAPLTSNVCNSPVPQEKETKIPQIGLENCGPEIISENGIIRKEKFLKNEKFEEFNFLTLLHNEPPVSSEFLASLFVEQRDFEAALRVVQPSAKREGFITVPDVTWDDIGSLQDIRHELQMSILAPVKEAEKCDLLGLSTPSGLLLCGPPGCGKTLMAKAIANEAEINFISVKGPELLNMYVGESERAVRQCFMRARHSSPCVIFFDELDALCPKRSDCDTTSTSRVVNQMLTEMDGIEGRKGVFVMAASNRPDIIDPAILRPGRLDKILYVGLPTAADRADILRALTKNGTKPKLAADVDLVGIANDTRCERYTGADLASLIREAGIQALTELISNPSVVPEVSQRHVNAAFNKVRPSVHEKEIKHYEKLRKLYAVTTNTVDVTLMETPVDEMIDPTLEAMET